MPPRNNCPADNMRSARLSAGGWLLVVWVGVVLTAGFWMGV